MHRFQTALRHRRHELRLSLKEAAAACGLSFAAYRATEQNLQCVSGWRIKQLAAGLKLDPVWLAEQAGYPVRKNEGE